MPKTSILTLVLLVLFVTSPIYGSDVDEILKSTQFDGGVAIVVGGDAHLISELAEAGQGRTFVEGLTTDAAAAARGRLALAKAGLFPLADIRDITAPNELPYVDAFASLVVVDCDELKGDGPSDEEILRVLGWDRAAAIRDSGQWRILKKPRTSDVGVWTHALHGPDRIPASSDEHLGPWIDSVRWIAAFGAADTREAVGGSRSMLSQRIAGGRVFTVIKAARNEALECRDAYSGLPLWTQPVDWVPESGLDTRYFSSGGSMAADDELVFCYPKIEGYLTAFDARTGKVVREYDKTVRVRKGEHPWGVRSTAPINDSGALAAAHVILVESSVLQSFKSKLWRLDRTTGDVLWEYDAGDKDWLLTPSVENDKAIYACLAEPATRGGPSVLRGIVRIDLKTGKEIWRADGERDLRCFGLTAPGGGILPIQVYRIEPDKLGKWRVDYMRDGDYELWGLDPETGERKWTVDGGAYRGYVYPLDGKVLEMPAYKSMVVRDPATGEVIQKYKYAADGGGCSFEVFSANFQVRGSQLHPRSSPQAAYFNNGSRPNCEKPSIPAYGAIYTLTAGCGCDHYLPSGVTCAITGCPLQPVPDNERVKTGDGATVAGPVADCRMDGPVPTDWTNTVDHKGKGKGFGWRNMDPAGAQELMKRFGNVGRGKSSIRWYGTTETAAVQAGDVYLVAITHQRRLESRRGQAPEPLTDAQLRDMQRKGIEPPACEVAWSFLAGGRIGSPPVVVDDLAIFGCHDGCVYAIRIDDGSLAWRSMVAPREQRMGAFSQVESSWPCFGVVEHDKEILTVAGRISTMDRGLFATSLDPRTGKPNWRVRLATDPIYAEDGSQELSKDVWWSNWIRTDQTLNIPPQIIDGKLRLLGNLLVDPKHPQDVVIGGFGYTP